MTAVRYRLNAPEVIQETMEGEALIIHTTTGVYYSLEGTGEFLWKSLLAGHTPAEVGAAFAEAGHGECAATTAAVKRFAQELAADQLIVPGDQTATPKPLAGVPQHFTTPSLLKYTDMQDLLLVDPIHEVDPQAGWPRLPETD